jgi:mRNA turnover protein 4
MPKSRRSKVIALTKTTKKGKDSKEKIVAEIRAAADIYQNIFVFEVCNMRTRSLQKLRTEFTGSKFFFGKNRVMALALGRTPQEEIKPNLHVLTKQLVGNVGLFMTNDDPEQITKHFQGIHEQVYARAGHLCEEEIMVQSGPLTQFAHPLEPHLRKLGLPTALKNGVIHLLKDFYLCQIGESLTPEHAKLLELFERKIATFELRPLCVWSNEKVKTLGERTQRSTKDAEEDYGVEEPEGEEPETLEEDDS